MSFCEPSAVSRELENSVQSTEYSVVTLQGCKEYSYSVQSTEGLSRDDTDGVFQGGYGGKRTPYHNIYFIRTYSIFCFFNSNAHHSVEY